MHRFATFVAVLLAALAVGGCSEGSSGASESGTVPTPAPAPPPAGRPTIAIDSPVSGTESVDYVVSVNGRVSNHRDGLALLVNGRAAVLQSSGAFSVRVRLLPGRNVVSVELREGSASLDAVSVLLDYVEPAGARRTIGQDGGSLSVPAGHPAAGSLLDVPAGAVAEDVLFSIGFLPLAQSPEPTQATAYPGRLGFEEEQFLDLPFGMLAVGPAITLRPIGLSPRSPLRLTLPFDSTRLPVGRVPADLRVLALTDDGWVDVTIESTLGGTARVNLRNLAFTAIVPAVAAPLAAGQLRISSNPPSAQVILDGIDAGILAPAVIDDLDPGDHRVQLYVPGFNEYSVTVTIPPNGGAELLPRLVPTPATRPEVSLDVDVRQATSVSEKLFEVRGDVTRTGRPLARGSGTLVHNGRVSLFEVSGGRWAVVLLLDSGENRISCRITDDEGVTGVCPPLEVAYQPPVARALQPTHSAIGQAVADAGIRVELKWNTNDTDVDLEVIDPSGRRAWYGQLDGIPGGLLDRDDVDGFGPEVFTMPDPGPGTYRVRVVYFSDNGRGPSAATARVALGGETLFEGGQVLQGSGARWEVFQFTVGALRIVSVQPLHDGDGIFTTLAGEDVVRVSLAADAAIDESTLRFAIRERREDVEFRAVHATRVAPLQYELRLTHKALLGFTDPDPSYPLEFAIKAIVGPEASPEDSNQVTIRQDLQSRVRQEYVDKRDFFPSFDRETPDRARIFTAADYVAPANLSFAELAQGSDFPAYAVIDLADDIFTAVRQQWGMPVRVHSGWRNPRKNDRLNGSARNSYHQTGSAIDLNPSSGPLGWPAEVLELPIAQRWVKAQMLLAETACEALSNDHFVLVHLNHVHIEHKGNGQGNGGAVGCPSVQ